MGQRRLEALSADPVRGFPAQDHCLPNRLVVDAPSIDYTSLLTAILGLGQQPRAVLAMMTRNRDDLVEDPVLILLGGHPVPVPYRCQQLLFRHPAHAYRHAIASRFCDRRSGPVSIMALNFSPSSQASANRSGSVFDTATHSAALWKGQPTHADRLSGRSGYFSANHLSQSGRRQPS